MPRPSKHDGVLYQRKESKTWWMLYRDKTGQRRLESTGCEDWQEANKKLRERLAARDNNILPIVRRGEQVSFGEWADCFLERYSKPPIREAKTHEANGNALKHIRPIFDEQKQTAIMGDQIEYYLRMRLRERKIVRRVAGPVDLGLLKPTTVHQEFRVMRRVFAVAVKKKLCPANPCSSVEFPVALKGLLRPHYMSWSEQLNLPRQNT